MKQISKNLVAAILLFAAIMGANAKSFVPKGGNCNTRLIELPAYSGRQGSQVRYYQESEGDSQPYFVVSFNTQYGVPDWVAWCLTAEHIDGAVARSYYDFVPDETIKGCPTKSSYNGVGRMTPKYSRGHFCPAADNKWSRGAMYDCFTTTNIAPQQQKMNAGKWGSLEEKCRKWAKRYGKVYIAAGPVIEKGMSRLPFNRKIAMPTRFYKVVLRHDGSSYQAIGWIFTADGKYTIMSVDDVEFITGLDFFHNLPDNIEKKVEATYDVNKWTGLKGW